MKIDKLLSYAVEKEASDLHLTANEPPIYRFDGKLSSYGDSNLDEKEVDGLLQVHEAQGEEAFGQSRPRTRGQPSSQQDGEGTRSNPRGLCTGS